MKRTLTALPLAVTPSVAGPALADVGGPGGMMFGMGTMGLVWALVVLVLVLGAFALVKYLR